MKKINFYIIVLLGLGVILKLYLTSGGHFIFHMDIARDFLDVREMVEIGKLRLTGPTSAIDGLYDGPLWYYLLTVPYFLSSGNPYSAVVMMIIAWAVGGFFLLRLISKFGKIPTIIAGLVWIGSDYVNLATSYSFHPHLITLLSPLFIYLLDRFITSPTVINSILIWALAGAFFNFEMNFGIFMPLIILLSGLVLNKRIFKKPSLYLGALAFIACLLPQVLFDFKYQHQMFTAAKSFIQTKPPTIFSPLTRASLIANNFHSVLLPTFLNSRILTNLSLFLVSCFLFLRYPKSNPLVACSLLLIAIPFIGFTLLPVTVNSWHLGGVIAPVIILSSYTISRLQKRLVGQLLASGLLVFITYLLVNKVGTFIQEHQQPSRDQSAYINEIQAVDYVYQYAKEKDFKVYTYLPSVYDFPYQYLFWYYGKNKYGHLPSEYRYLPNKPNYVPSQAKFQTKDKLADSGLIFLIKEPDDLKRRELWENNFKNLTLINSVNIGPLIVETRQATTIFHASN